MTWTAEEEAWLAEAWPQMRMDGLVRDHAERFGFERTAAAIRSRAKLLGLRKGEGYVRNPPFWTGERIALIRTLAPGRSWREIAGEFERETGIRLTRSQVKNAKTRFGARSGTHGGRFEKGHESPNKGRPWAEWMPPESQEACRRTQFRKGEVRDRPDGWLKPVGHERVDRDGYTWVKVMDSREDGIQPQEPGSFNRNYRLKHVVEYEKAHGPVPEGCNVVFADRDKGNFDPGNLVAVPRAAWAAINRKGIAYCDRESLEAAVALAGLDSARYAAEQALRER